MGDTEKQYWKGIKRWCMNEYKKDKMWSMLAAYSYENKNSGISVKVPLQGCLKT